MGILSCPFPYYKNYETKDHGNYGLNQSKTLAGSVPLEPEAELRLWMSLWTSKRGKEMSAAQQVADSRLVAAEITGLFLTTNKSLARAYSTC